MAYTDFGKPIHPDLLEEELLTYLEQGRHYLANSEKLANERDFGKAGEAMWGAAASALKALLLARASRVLGRGEVDRFGKQVAVELRLPEEFASVRGLHANFYDAHKDAEDVLRDIARGTRYVRTVMEAAVATRGTLTSP